MEFSCIRYFGVIVIWGGVQGCATTTLPLNPPQCEGPCGAIAYSERARTWGFSWNAQNDLIARQDAIERCGSGDCAIVVEFGPRECAALAVGTTQYGVGHGENALVAERMAKERCEGSDCLLQPAECNTEIVEDAPVITPQRIEGVPLMLSATKN